MKNYTLLWEIQIPLNVAMFKHLVQFTEVLFAGEIWSRLVIVILNAGCYHIFGVCTMKSNKCAHASCHLCLSAYNNLRFAGHISLNFILRSFTKIYLYITILVKVTWQMWMLYMKNSMHFCILSVPQYKKLSFPSVRLLADINRLPTSKLVTCERRSHTQTQ